jgi:hypothetical protein
MQGQQKRRGIPFLRKVLLFLILLGIFASIGIWYANEYILPVKGKAFAIEYLTKATGREVTLESIYYNPFRGITLRNLTFSDDLKYNRKFLEIKKLYFNILYIPLFQEKKIIVPLIKVESPKLILTVDNENKWNFESLLFLNQPQAKPQGYSVIVSGISVSDAACAFEDRALEPAFSKDLKNIDFRATISYLLKIKYKLNAELGINQKNSISADGEFDPVKKETILNLRLKNVPFAEFQPYYAGLPFKSLSGNLSGNVSLLYVPDNKLTVEALSTIGSLNIMGEEVAIKSGVDLSGRMVMELKDKTKIPCSISAAAKMDNLELNAKDFSFKGGVDVNGKVAFDLKDKTTLKYSADALLRDAVLKGVPEFGAVEKINGKIFLDENKLWADSMKGAARGLDLIFSGSVKNYADPYLDLTAKTEINLIRLNEFLPPELKDKLKGYETAGKSKVALSVKGSLKEQDKTPLSSVLTAELLNCAIKPDFLDKTITSVTGLLTYKADSVNLKNLSGNFDDKTYTLNGDITNLKAPVFNLALASDDLNLKTNFKPVEDSLLFNKFEGNYKKVKFGLFGSVAGFKDPLLDLHGSIAADINELKNYLPKENAETLDKFGVSGALSSKFVFNGKWKDQKTWQIELKAESPRLEVKKLKLDDLYLEYKFKDNFVSMPNITARPYGGNLTANVAIDFTQQNPQYVIQVSLKEIDIGKWKNDTEFKNTDMRGLFYANAEFGGFGNNIETLRGKGAFAIANGKLWELPVFAGLANILYIPGVSKIVFGEAKGTFTIGNRVIVTGNTELYSPQISLIGEGSVDFDGNLDFDITAAFAKEFLQGPTPIGPLRDFFVDEMGNFVGKIKLTGTTKDPKYQITTFSLEGILRNKLLNRLREGLFGGSSE